TAAATDAWWCPQRTTAAPPAPSRRAHARPIPSEPPVTTATLPAKSAIDDTRGEPEVTPRARCQLERRAVGDRLGESVRRVARERLEPDVVVASVPGVAGRAPELLPEPEVRHHRSVPLDAQTEALPAAHDLVPSIRKARQVEELALRPARWDHVQSHLGPGLVLASRPEEATGA